MSKIKKILPTSKSGYKQSYYEPKNIQKYLGSFPIICRSSWERKFATFCDTNKKVIRWSSESLEITYYNILDKKFHKYYPDYVVWIKRDDAVVIYIVEVKPSAQLTKPSPPKVKTEKALMAYKKAHEVYITNLCKINALKKYAEARKYKVLLLTEKSKLI